LNSEINIKRRKHRASVQKTILRLKKIKDELRYHPNYYEQRAEFETEIAQLEQEINSLVSSISGPLD
jgi:type IV secretory pathway VirD2 relaxase